MTNTQRNTTVIGVVLAILIGSGYYILHRLKKEEKIIKGKNQELKVEIEKFDTMLAQRERIEREYEELKLFLAQQSKIISLTDNPALTYNYLLKLLKWMGRNVNFDFSLSSKKATDINWNEYILSGNSDFIDVVNFIKNLEYQRPLITIEEVTIVDKQNAVTDSVNFSLVIKTHYNSEGSPIEEIQEKDFPVYKSSFVSFRPRIYETPPETDIDPSLVRIDKAIIVGITESRAFLRDEFGIIHILSAGDPVAYGYLYSIDLKQEKLVFRINQYGSTEEKTLFMQKTTK